MIRTAVLSLTEMGYVNCVMRLLFRNEVIEVRHKIGVNQIFTLSHFQNVNSEF